MSHKLWAGMRHLVELSPGMDEGVKRAADFQQEAPAPFPRPFPSVPNSILLV